RRRPDDPHRRAERAEGDEPARPLLRRGRAGHPVRPARAQPAPGAAPGGGAVPPRMALPRPSARPRRPADLQRDRAPAAHRRGGHRVLHHPVRPDGAVGPERAPPRRAGGARGDGDRPRPLRAEVAALHRRLLRGRAVPRRRRPATRAARRGGPVTGGGRRTALVFPGMAPSNHTAVGAFMRTDPGVRRLLARADEALGYPVLERVRDAGPDYAEPGRVAFVVNCLALAERAVERRGLRPELCVGPSFGQMAAMGHTGVLPFAELVRITAELA